MKFSFVQKTSLQVQNIWKDEEFSNWLLLPLGPQSFQELVKAFKNCKHSGYVDHQQVRLIDQNLIFFKLKLLIFRRWWQLRMKVLNEFILPQAQWTLVNIHINFVLVTIHTPRTSLIAFWLAH